MQQQGHCIAPLLAWIWTLAASLLVWPSLACASPWNPGKGDTLVINRVETFHGDSGEASFEKIANQVWLEQGLTDRLMLGGNLILATQSNDGPFPASMTGLSTVEAWLQHQIHRSDRTVLAGRLLYAAETDITLHRPGGSDTVGEDAAAEYAVLLGHSFDDRGTRFASAELGLRKSFGAEPDRLRSQLVLGQKYGRHWLLMLKSLNTVSLGNAGTSSAEYDVYRIEPVVAYTTDRDRTYELGIRHDISGRNIATGTAAFISLWSRF